MKFPEPLRLLYSVATTVETQADATRLAQGMVQARLAACVQVEPIVSHYVWEHALQQGPEFRLVCKTSADALAPLLQWLRGHHPYQLPQLLVQPLQATLDYAAWVEAQTVQPVQA